MNNPISSTTRSSILLCVGAIVGIVLATSGIIGNDPMLFDNQTSIATVNDVSISTTQLHSILKTISAESKQPLSTDKAQLILNRLIDEELMVQRGYELGYLELNSTIRNTIVLAVKNSIKAEVSGRDLSNNQLHDFYEDNTSYFSTSPQLHVQTMQFDIDQGNPQAARLKAHQAHGRLVQGEDFEIVKKAAASREIFTVPNGLLSSTKLREYVGPTLVSQISRMKIGDFSQPLRNTNSWTIIHLVDLQPGSAPDFNDIRSTVEVELRRKTTESEITDYIKWLRKRASIYAPTSAELQALITKP